MKIEILQFKFPYKGRLLNATCQVMHIYKMPQYRVVVEMPMSRTEVYILYKTKHEGRSFFWYELEGKKQEIAKLIASELEKTVMITQDRN